MGRHPSGNELGLSNLELPGAHTELQKLSAITHINDNIVMTMIPSDKRGVAKSRVPSASTLIYIDQ